MTDTPSHLPRPLDIPGTWNARDVGGWAVPQGSTRPLRTGVLLRTASLSALSDLGVQALADLGVTTVCDLRGDEEVDRDGPDRAPETAQVLRRPLTPLDAGAVTADGSALIAQLFQTADPDIARKVMAGVYDSFVDDAAIRSQIGATLADLAAAPGATLVHCAAGKDRTGWVVAIVQYLCGVDESARLTEYLTSAHDIEALAAALPQIPGMDPAVMEPLLTVEPDYLLGAWERAVREFGSFDGYLGACGLAHTTRETIVERFVG